MQKSKKSTYIIAAVALVALLLGIYFLFVFKKSQKDIELTNSSTGEIKQVSDINLSNRPYITLTPTSDGAEIILSFQNMGFFDSIEYELTYQADNPTAPGTKIERGSTGSDVNTKDSTYKKSILLGTASRGVRSPDRGITDGKLTMHLFKKGQEFLSESNWDLSTVGSTDNILKSRDGNVAIVVPNLGKDYWAIIANTIGVPQGGKFEISKVQLPVYGAFSIAGNFPTSATLTIKERAGNKLFSYSHQDNSWKEITSTTKGNDLVAKVSNFATYVVVSSK
jgi:hypothetical protein